MNETFPLPSFSVPPLPSSPRVWHTLTENILCGGVYPDTLTSCVQLSERGWESYSTELQRPRLAHSAWASPQGLVLLGGYDNDNAELVTTTGTTILFTMDRNIR